MNDTEKKVVPARGYELRLKTPIKLGNQTLNTLIFDFEALTGRDMIAVENEMAALGEPLTMPEFSTSFQAKIAARAAKIGSDVIADLPLYEFKIITGRARSFLLGTD